MTKKTRPVFSVITCTKNSEKFIQENLKSVANQTFSDFEHLIIDGKSIDKTLNLVKKYQIKNKKLDIKVISKKANGIADAMNQGIKKAQGKYIFILHSDDSFYHKNVLKNAAKFINNNKDLDWFYGKIRVVDEENKVIGFFPTRWIFQQSWKYLLKFINYIPHQAVFMKKEVFDKYGLFQAKFKSAMDQELWLRINYQTNWSFFLETMANYRVHKNAQSSSKANFEKNWQEYLNIQNKYLKNWEKPLAFVVNYLVRKVNKTVR
jgi:glycosyltransferase involved in cell wall biosynthesis